MAEMPPLCFGPFRLAGPRGPLLRSDQRMELKPRALAVLWELVRHAGDVVTKSHLRETLWPRAVVGEDALAFQIQALRRILDDDARHPRFIATCHRVGYSFIAPVSSAARLAHVGIESVDSPSVADGSRSMPIFVGRDAQLASLNQSYARALRGERQLVLVSGEAGIGKSALLQQFLAQVGSAPRVGHGQCVEHYGAGEGYMPVLEALGSICRQPRREDVIEVLQRGAPTWLLQLPALLSPEQLAGLQQRTVGAARERMLREIADALEAIALDVPLILVLEDLHWSDPSTLDMLSLVARRSAPARLLILGTYRPMDVIAAHHPLMPMKQELVARGRATELALEGLRPADVRSYLVQRFPESADEDSLSTFVYRRSEGHPLFVVQMADYLATESEASGNVLAQARETLESAVPRGLRELIDVQLDRLADAERHVLEIASVAGAEFAIASVSAGASMPIEIAEVHCELLARHGQFIEARGLASWPDGTGSGRYAFRHALYQDVLAARLSARRRAQAHRAIGLREESGYGERVAEIAAELAAHFERGQEFDRAVEYGQSAGEKALERSANAEAIDHFRKALDLLAMLPATSSRAQRELRLQVALSLGLTMSKGYSAPEAEGVIARAHALCQQMEETPDLSAALFRIERFHLVRGEIHAARALGDQLLRIARAAGSPTLLSQAHTAAAFEFFSLGDFSAAQEHAEQSIWRDNPGRSGASTNASGDDSSAVSYCLRAFALQARGFPDQACQSLDKGVAMAKGLGLPFALGGALLSTADLHLLRRDSGAVQEVAEALIDHAVREGFPYYVARATVLRGWALAEQGQAAAGIAEIHHGLSIFDGMGARQWLPCCLGLLAEAYGRAGKLNEALRVVSEALEIAERTGERQYEAELHRVKGELVLQQSESNRPQAEACFNRAIAVARVQAAKTYELRAAVSLIRSQQQQGECAAARQLLAEILGWFSEGFDTTDWRSANAVLSEAAE